MNIVSELADRLFPQFCKICDTEGLLICRTCMSALVGGGIVSTFGDASHQKIIAYTNYADRVAQEIVHLCKYEYIELMGLKMGILLGNSIAKMNLFDTETVLVPVPLHIKRFRERGFNQATLIARGIAIITGLPIDENIIERKIATKRQVDLNELARRANVDGVFKVKKIVSKKVVLVDDVSTTGATLMSAIHALHEAGICEVQAVVFARG